MMLAGVEYEQYVSLQNVAVPATAAAITPPPLGPLEKSKNA